MLEYSHGIMLVWSKQISSLVLSWPASRVHHVLAGPISSEGASSGVVGNSQDIDEAMSTPNGRIEQRPQSSGVCLNALLSPSSSRRGYYYSLRTMSRLQLIWYANTIWGALTGKSDMIL